MRPKRIALEIQVTEDFDTIKELNEISQVDRLVLAVVVFLSQEASCISAYFKQV